MNIKSKITVPNCITASRIVGTIAMMFTTIFTREFYVIYTLCGLTDVLDGFIARMTKKTSEFGARLDSIADLLFYGVMLTKLLPEMLGAMPDAMPWMIASLIAVRLVSYGIAAFKHKKFASLHTYMNKFSGLLAFSMPYLVGFVSQQVVYSIVYTVAMLAAVEELVIHIYTATYKSGNRTVIKVVKDGKEQ